MSKSLGNGIEPQAVTQKLGAEIIRLWVAASDYSGDIAATTKSWPAWWTPTPHPQHAALLLANISDFDAAHDAVPLAQMLEIDRWALSRARRSFAEVLAHYEAYEFHPCRGQVAALLAAKTWAGFTWTSSKTASTPRQRNRWRGAAPKPPCGTSPRHAAPNGAILSFTAEAWQLVGHSESIFMQTCAARCPRPTMPC